MAHTLDEVIAVQDEEKAKLAEVATLVQSLKDKISAIPGIPADVQAKIEQVFDNETANKSALDAVVNQSSAQL